MDKLIINNLTLSELHDLECVLHHIIACYVNSSDTITSPLTGTEYRTTKSVLLSKDDFNALSKFHQNLYSKLFD